MKILYLLPVLVPIAIWMEIADVGVHTTMFVVSALALVGNVGEHVVAVQVALKNRMELSTGIAVGPVLQIAIFVAPVLITIMISIDGGRTGWRGRSSSRSMSLSTWRSISCRSGCLYRRLCAGRSFEPPHGRRDGLFGRRLSLAFGMETG